jgi:hypothetical protein
MSKRPNNKVAVSDNKDLPAAELLSFLKEVRGVQTWTEKDLASSLRIGLPQAKEAIAVLQLQGLHRPSRQYEKVESHRRR